MLTRRDFIKTAALASWLPPFEASAQYDTQKELGDRDWTDLFYLAHADKFEAFRRYASYYLSTNGQLYWSDEHQMSIYPDHYHRELDKKLQSKHKRRQLLPHLSQACHPQAGRGLLPAVPRVPQIEAQARPGRSVPERLVPALQEDVLGLKWESGSTGLNGLPRCCGL